MLPTLPDEAETHTREAAQQRLYHEVVALMRDLELATNDAEGMELAGKFVAALTAHIDPLRSAISDVEFYTEAERIVAGLRVIGSLDAVTGGSHG